ncbi:MAG TPA: NADH:flavin oxidoreductase [Mycobacteriales bacterium]|nr:NADH:flavin oxidoreductase [Mycobacteriales bacterium]
MTDSTPRTRPDVFAPAQLGPLTLRNRIIKAATFEGMSYRGKVSDELIDFHRATAAGGVGMTTVAYCAASPGGRGAPNELVPRPELVPDLKRLADAVHGEGAAISAQVGHAGPIGNARVTGSKALAASSGFSPLGTRYHAMTVADIESTIADFANAARLLAEAGFDAVEIHMGHHYLINSFMSPRFNKREDEWGGDATRRARFAREVARAVREAVGPRIAVLAKLEMEDGVPRGLTVADSVPIAKLLEDDGHVDALELTGGGSLANPMYLFRGDVPRKEFAATLPAVLRPAFKLVGKRFMPEYPYEEAYFLGEARQFRAALSMPLVLLGGISTLETVQRAMAEGFDFVAMGRALLREPDLVNRMRDGQASESTCIHCNKCMPTIYRGTHCVYLEPGDRPGLRVSAQSQKQ